MKKTPRPTRYGHVLRRLLDGKTSAINWQIANKLESDGLVTLDAPNIGKASVVKVHLTERGRQAALVSKRGVRVYNRDHQFFREGIT